MTASMAASREPDDGDVTESHIATVTPVPIEPMPVADGVTQPPKPQISADEAAALAVADVPAVDASVPPKPAKKAPRKKRSPHRAGGFALAAATAPVVPDPGPPPPLPPDLASPEGEASPESLPVVESAPTHVEDAPPADLDVIVPPIPPPPVAAAVVAAVVAEPIAAEPEAEDAEPSVAVPEAEAPVDHAAVEALAVVFDEQLDAAPGAATAIPALTLRGVTKTFGETHAVDGIDLTVPSGTFYGIVGPNGAGKTTTLSMIAGLLRPDKGRITVNGVDAASDSRAAKRSMGVLPDRLRTFDRLTGRQLLYYYGILRGLSPAVVESRTADLARAFDLTGALGRVVSDYSTGMTKKVMLAGAMIHSPRLLVLDEPFESVDPVSSAIILDILATYVAHGGTVVLSSHGMDLVERVCTRVAVIVAGQVLAEGTIDEVRGELTLEQRFIELAGGLSDVEGLEWLHTFSD